MKNIILAFLMVFSISNMVFAFEIPERTLPVKKMRVCEKLKLSKEKETVSIYETCVDGNVFYLIVPENGNITMQQVFEGNHPKQCY